MATEERLIRLVTLMMKLRPVAFALVLAVMLFGTGISCEKSSSEDNGSTQTIQVNVEPLSIAEKDLTIGERDGGVYMLINVFYYRKVLAAATTEQVGQILIRTAEYYAGEAFARDDFASLTKARAEFIYLPESDEYGDPDFSEVVKHGGVTLEKAEGGDPNVVDSNIHFRPKP